jgi:hypothetical protein
MIRRWKIQSEPITIREPAPDDPPFAWIKSSGFGDLSLGILGEALADCADETGARHVALAIVKHKSVTKRLAKMREKPLIEMLDRKRRWDREVLLAGRIDRVFFRTYEPFEWFEEVTRRAFREGKNAPGQTLNFVYCELRLNDADAVDRALSDVGVRPSTLAHVLRDMASSS